MPQVSALRKALGADREVIRTEFGRGYRFTGVLCSDAAPDGYQRPTPAKLWSTPTLPSRVSGRGLGKGPQTWRQSLRTRGFSSS